MGSSPSKFEFSADMFEQALAAETWQQPEPAPNPQQVEASDQLAELAANVASYGATPMPDTFAGAGPTDPPQAAEPVPTEPVSALPVSEPAPAGASWAEAVAKAQAPAPQEPAARQEPIATWRLDRPGELFVALRQDCPTAYLEQFQLLRTQLLLMRAQCASDADFTCVCLTSASKGEGKTFTARNLAATLTMASGKKVLLIETGARERTMPAGVLGLEAALADRAQWRRCVAELATSGLSVLPGFQNGQVIDFEPLPALIDELRPHFDWIVIDAPAIHDAAPAEWVVAAADAALIVVREGQTSFDSLADACARIPPGRLAGFVINKMAKAKRKTWLPRLPKVRIRWSKSTPVV